MKASRHHEEGNFYKIEYAEKSYPSGNKAAAGIAFFVSYESTILSYDTNPPGDAHAAQRKAAALPCGDQSKEKNANICFVWED